MATSVKGVSLDDATRCEHYHTKEDIIAIRCGCCHEYYACYKCHEALCGSAPKPLPKRLLNEPNVLCGECQAQLTVHEYLNANYQCPSCGSAFNPSCSRHYSLYFDLDVK